MSVAAVLVPADYESRLQRYLFERSEEGRAVRVGEKEVSERAEIVGRYSDLFTRAQLEALREAEEVASPGDERERLYRLRKTCEAGLIAAELAAREDALENAVLAARVEFQGEELPLRSAQAKLAVLTSYAERDELGGDDSALAHLAQPVELLPLLPRRGALGVPQSVQLRPREELGVTRDDLRLLGDLLLADADGAALLGALVQVALDLLFEFRRRADGRGRHRGDSIDRKAPTVAGSGGCEPQNRARPFTP